MLNWFVWNGAVLDIETVFMLNWIVWNRTVLCKQRLYLYWTEMFELELFG